MKPVEQPFPVEDRYKSIFQAANNLQSTKFLSMAFVMVAL